MGRLGGQGTLFLALLLAGLFGISCAKEAATPSLTPTPGQAPTEIAAPIRTSTSAPTPTPVTSRATPSPAPSATATATTISASAVSTPTTGPAPARTTIAATAGAPPPIPGSHVGRVGGCEVCHASGGGAKDGENEAPMWPTSPRSPDHTGFAPVMSVASCQACHEGP